MILFFGDVDSTIFAVETKNKLPKTIIGKLSWLFGEKKTISVDLLKGAYVGPRTAVITPWSTNAVEITQNMGIWGIKRIEKFNPLVENVPFDPMLLQKYEALSHSIFKVEIEPDAIKNIENIGEFNKKEGLALSDEEVVYLEQISTKIGRPLTDSEVFGFSQINSEHCRHKIFNGTFIIDGEEKEESLFSLIKKTSKVTPGNIVSAYKDNVAFIKGPSVMQFAPRTSHQADYYVKKPFESVISLKAETHNFPTTVEPFNGAATGAGGEIRDRLAGGRGSLPLAGSALYMTSYSRLNDNRPWEKGMTEREWLYQSPIDILIKASNGASDFGNKFGQPLINGSLLTFEHEEAGRKLGFDKVIMLAGGVGYGKANQAQKGLPKAGDTILVLGGDNYRIGMGGAAVSSAEGGEFNSGIELNAVQRSNPEMQKRVANTIRGMVENDVNPIVSIHDHGAGGHLNCLSELVEETGGKIDLARLPIGDPTLSAKEIIGNESQERMGLIIPPEHVKDARKIAKRERAPMYEVGVVTDDGRFTFESSTKGDKPMDLALEDMFGSSPKTILRDSTKQYKYKALEYTADKLQDYIKNVLKMEAVACKDWLTNKVDRCVGGKVAKQQCAGPLQLPLNNCGVMALDYEGTHGIATSVGHAPVSALIDATAGSRVAITEALTNIMWAPLKDGLSAISLSANWMWPAKNEGEDARLFEAVQAVSDFAIELGINIPTGKDSLSMKQKYPNEEVYAPGTVVISAVGHCNDITKVVEPVFQLDGGDIYYINLSQDSYKLGGSSFAQTMNRLGAETPSVNDAVKLKLTFNAIQDLICNDFISAGHDISSGGLLTTLLEMCFPTPDISANIDLSALHEEDIIKLLLSENNGIIFQSSSDDMEDYFGEEYVHCIKIGKVTKGQTLNIKHGQENYSFDVPSLRDDWFETSYLLDCKQSGELKAKERYDNYKNQALKFTFPQSHTGALPIIDHSITRPRAGILREKGSNSERELAHALYLAGFDVKDIHMTDIMSGRETLEDVQFLGAVGGFSNSDVLGSAKGWAGVCIYNEKVRTAINNFFAREDTLSIGICNGCQLFMELNLINPTHEKKGNLTYNDSNKHESNFTSVSIPKNNSVMLTSLEGSTLGVWISHGEGKFILPEEEHKYNIVAKYGYDTYPANPNGSDYNTAMLCSEDGKHLVMMPHIERSVFKWNWAHYEAGKNDVVSPWIEAFVNARNHLVKIAEK